MLHGPPPAEKFLFLASLLCVRFGTGVRENRGSQGSAIDLGQLSVDGERFGLRGGRKIRVQRRRESDPTAGLIDLLCGRRLFSQLAESYLTRNTSLSLSLSHTHILK